jgi:hypothetical protein
VEDQSVDDIVHIQGVVQSDAAREDNILDLNIEDIVAIYIIGFVEKRFRKDYGECPGLSSNHSLSVLLPPLGVVIIGDDVGYVVSDLVLPMLIRYMAHLP